jgi:hypothetical protein
MIGVNLFGVEKVLLRPTLTKRYIFLGLLTSIPPAKGEIALVQTIEAGPTQMLTVILATIMQ